MKAFIVDSIIIVGLFGFSNEKEVLVKEYDSEKIYAYVENVEDLNESSHLINAYVENLEVLNESPHLINAYIEDLNNIENNIDGHQFILPKYIFES